jgi:recombinational DNA repair protein (RecF pathway)
MTINAPVEQNTDFLILRLTPYQEHSVILGGISPQFGRMSFFVRRSTGTRRNYSCIDLFRLVNISWHRSNGELNYASEIIEISNYGAIATKPQAYMAACDLARFAMANVLVNSAMPHFFNAMRVAFIRLIESSLPADAIRTCVGLVFLNEGGWLSSHTLDSASAAQCELLLRMADGGDIPALTPENWTQLWNWTQSLLLAADCIV